MTDVLGAETVFGAELVGPTAVLFRLSCCTRARSVFISLLESPLEPAYSLRPSVIASLKVLTMSES